MNIINIIFDKYTFPIYGTQISSFKYIETLIRFENDKSIKTFKLTNVILKTLNYHMVDYVINVEKINNMLNFIFYHIKSFSECVKTFNEYDVYVFFFMLDILQVDHDLLVEIYFCENFYKSILEILNIDYDINMILDHPSCDFHDKLSDCFEEIEKTSYQDYSLIINIMSFILHHINLCYKEECCWYVTSMLDFIEKNIHLKQLTKMVKILIKHYISDNEKTHIFIEVTGYYENPEKFNSCNLIFTNGVFNFECYESSILNVNDWKQFYKDLCNDNDPYLLVKDNRTNRWHIQQVGDYLEWSTIVTLNNSALIDSSTSFKFKITDYLLEKIEQMINEEFPKFRTLSDQYF